MNMFLYLLDITQNPMIMKSGVAFFHFNSKFVFTYTIKLHHILARVKEFISPSGDCDVMHRTEGGMPLFLYCVPPPPPETQYDF